MTDKPEKVKKEGRLKKWWRETIGELHKVYWPTRKEAWRLTKIVLLVMVIMGGFLGLLDYGLTALVGLIVK